MNTISTIESFGDDNSLRTFFCEIICSVEKDKKKSNKRKQLLQHHQHRINMHHPLIFTTQSHCYLYADTCLRHQVLTSVPSMGLAHVRRSSLSLPKKYLLFARYMDPPFNCCNLPPSPLITGSEMAFGSESPNQSGWNGRISL